MVKSKVSNQAYLSTTFTVILGLSVIGIASYLGKLDQSIYGYNPPVEIAENLHKILSFVVGLFGLSILFNFRKLTHVEILRRLAIATAAFMFLFGWALTSASSAGQIQNDGFNVTGGFLMFFSGLYIGYTSTDARHRNPSSQSKEKKNGKK